MPINKKYFTTMGKKHVFILSVFLIMNINILHSQEYVPFPDSNAIWSEVFTNQQPFEIITYQYGIWGDTIINSELYKKVYELTDTTFPVSVGQFCGGLREDSLKRIYVINCMCSFPGAGDDEVLLYDFSKCVGDTVFVGMDGIGPMGYYIIVHIDSIQINNNYRKTFHFPFEDYWIEGIGSTRGLFSPIVAQPTGHQDWDLICFNQEEQVLYLNPDYSNCFPILTSIIDHTPPIGCKISIYPHPIINTSTIKLNRRYDNVQMEIYNLFGVCVQRLDMHGKLSIQINSSEFTSGLYFYKVLINQQEILKGKILVIN